MKKINNTIGIIGLICVLAVAFIKPESKARADQPTRQVQHEVIILGYDEQYTYNGTYNAQTGLKVAWVSRSPGAPTPTLGINLATFEADLMNQGYIETTPVIYGQDKFVK